MNRKTRTDEYIPTILKDTGINKVIESFEGFDIVQRTVDQPIKRSKTKRSFVLLSLYRKYEK